MSKTIPYSLPVLGMDILSNETNLIKGTVRSAKNVDISRDGSFARRPGAATVVALAGAHSIYYAPQKRWILVAVGSKLYRMDGTSYALTELYTLGSADQVSYTEYNGNVYISNRTTICWIPSDSNVVRKVGVSTPPAPSLSETTGGLTPGKYGVVITVVDDRGEESGASVFTTIQLPTGGGIRLSGLPEIAGANINIYITSPDGDVLRRSATFPAVFPSYVTADTPQGAQPDTQYLVPMPAGDIIRHHNGRLFTAKGNTLYFSEALRPHLYNPAYGAIPFSGDITFVEAVNDGVYVGDARGVWFLSATDPVKFEQRRVSPHRVVAKSSVMVPAGHFDKRTVQTISPAAVWLSTAGHVAGVSGGNCVELNSDRVKLENGLSGNTALIMRDGRKQIVTTVNSNITTMVNGAGVNAPTPSNNEPDVVPPEFFPPQLPIFTFFP